MGTVTAPLYTKIGQTYTDWDGYRHTYSIYVCHDCGVGVIDQELHTHAHAHGTLPLPPLT